MRLIKSSALLVFLGAACQETSGQQVIDMAAAEVTCSLTVTVSGTGVVTAAQGGAMCGPEEACVLSVKCGSSLTLHPRPGPQAYDHIWMKGCVPHGDCVLSIQQSTEAVIRFLPREMDGPDFYRYNPPPPEGSEPITNKRLSAIWGSSSDDVWVGGADGLLLHFDGSVWSQIPSGTIQAINGIWGSSPDDVWAVGTLGTILHYQAGIWGSPAGGLTSRQLISVWGSGSADVWAVGEAGALFHYRGSGWAASPQSGLIPGALRSIHGSGPSDIWTVGEGGALVHFDGANWTVAPQSGVITDGSLGAVRVLSPALAWATGAPGFLRYTGQRWEMVGVPAEVLGPSSLWSPDSKTLWGGVYRRQVVRFNGTSWSAVVPINLAGGEDWNAVWGSSEKDFWLVGSNGTISRYAPR